MTTQEYSKGEVGMTGPFGYLQAPEDFWKKSNPPVVLVLDALKLIWALRKVLDLKKEISLESENKIVRRKVKQINTT